MRGLEEKDCWTVFFVSKFQYLQSNKVFSCPFSMCLFFFVSGGLCCVREDFGKDTAQTGTNWMLIWYFWWLCDAMGVDFSIFPPHADLLWTKWIPNPAKPIDKNTYLENGGCFKTIATGFSNQNKSKQDCARLLSSFSVHSFLKWLF